MDEGYQKDRQRTAYENREAIQPGDRLTLICSEADSMTASFPVGDSVLIAKQKERPFRPGDPLRIECRTRTVGSNCLGPFVDYEFTAKELDSVIRINGPDAQTLAEIKHRPRTVKNRDIPVLQEVMACMQAVCRTEELREWQRARMVKITQSLSGMPGGGGAKGTDEAFAALDETTCELKESCREYTGRLRMAQRILNGIGSRRLRAIVLMKYVMDINIFYI